MIRCCLDGRLHSASEGWNVIAIVKTQSALN
jgi:hypothetical protein